jgi:hypothetical protein
LALLAEVSYSVPYELVAAGSADPFDCEGKAEVGEELLFSDL